MSSSQQNKTYVGVFFDWKGTLCAKGGGKKKIEREKDALQACDALFTDSDDFIFSKIYRQVQTQHLDKHEVIGRGALLDRVLAQIGETSRAEQVHNTYFKLFKGDPSQQKLYPGAEDLLKRLHQNQNVFTALIRNSTLPNKEMMKTLHTYKVDHLFDIVVMSGDCKAEKPSKQIFQYTVDQLASKSCQFAKLISENEKSIVFIGNETDADIVGANAMGWDSVLITNTESTSNGKATFDVCNLKELEQRVLKETLNQ
mmetsp:Transcript_8436/g.12837  ORF Transcript_8436/g.12837 Transcript_8436/m.12837 type:complete len:256 (+) Transcript_8436:57-824(+)